MADNLQIAKDILPFIGGRENVAQAMHCMTRLRLTLRDNKKADLEGLKKVTGVMGCQFSGTQLQIIIGTNVGKVYDEFIKLTGVAAESAVEENLDAPEKKRSIIDRVFDYISGSMTPVLPALIISGLVKTIVAIFGPQLLGIISEGSDLYTLFTFVGDAGMYFLPFFLAVSASRKLGANWGIGAYLAAIMLHPTFTQMAAEGTGFSVYGIPASVQNYSNSVMPILLSVWVMSYVERFIKKHLPDALQVLIVPLVTVLVMTPITLCILGPAGAFLSNYICGGIIKLYDLVGPFATMLIGALFIPIVFTGMHPILYVYLMTTFPVLGYDAFFLPGVAASSWAAAGAFLACMLKFKNKESKSFTISCFVTWLIGGVGEPFMYGVLIRNRKLLTAAIIGGAAAGLTAGLTGLTAHVLATANGIYSLFAFLGGSVWNYAALVITIAVGIAVSFIACMLLKITDTETN